MFYVTQRNVEENFVLFLLLENPRPLSPRGPLDFLPTCLGIGSLSCIGPNTLEVRVAGQDRCTKAGGLEGRQVAAFASLLGLTSVALCPSPE